MKNNVITILLISIPLIFILVTVICGNLTVRSVLNISPDLSYELPDKIITTPDQLLDITERSIKTSESLLEVSKKIMNREIIEDSWFNYITDPPLVDDIKEYNQITAALSLYYTREALLTIIELCDLTDENGTQFSLDPPDIHRIPLEYRQLTEKITNYCLYRNTVELLYGDSALAQLIVGELDDSYEQWSWHIQEKGVTAAGMTMADLDDYFNLADRIIVRLSW